MLITPPLPSAWVTVISSAVSSVMFIVSALSPGFSPLNTTFLLSSIRAHLPFCVYCWPIMFIDVSQVPSPLHVKVICFIASMVILPISMVCFAIALEALSLVVSIAFWAIAIWSSKAWLLIELTCHFFTNIFAGFIPPLQLYKNAVAQIATNKEVILFFIGIYILCRKCNKVF